jgi:hypothetical protein
MTATSQRISAPSVLIGANCASATADGDPAGKCRVFVGFPGAGRAQVTAEVPAVGVRRFRRLLHGGMKSTGGPGPPVLTRSAQQGNELADHDDEVRVHRIHPFRKFTRRAASSLVVEGFRQAKLHPETAKSAGVSCFRKRRKQCAPIRETGDGVVGRRG